jgi:ribose transport system substrate-binding protein
MGTYVRGGMFAAAGVCLTLGLAACGSSSNSSTSTAAAGAATSQNASTGSQCGGAALKAEVAKLQTRPTSIGISDPVKGGIKPGKSIVWIQGPYPDAHAFGDELKKIGKKVGWTIHTVDADGSPEQVKAAWQEALRLKPDAISQGGGGWPKPPYAAEAKQALKDGIVIPGFAEGARGYPFKFSIGYGEPDGWGRTGYGDVSALEAAANIKDGDKVLSLNLPGIGLVQSQVAEFKSKLKEYCPKTTVDVFDVPLSSLGKDAPTRIASYLQAHPDYKFMYLTTIDLGIGLDAAYKASGVTPPKTFSITSDKQGLTILKNHEAGLIGTLHGSSGSYEGAYRLVDGLARLDAGQSTAVDEDPSGNIPKWIVTADNLPSGEDPLPAVKDGPAQFYKLWGVQG